MRSDSPCPMYRVLTDPIKPESQPTLITQCRNPCVIKSIILGLHPMIILQNKFHLFSNKKLFGCSPQRSFVFKYPCVFYGWRIFWGPTVGFANVPTLLRAFIDGSICVTKNITELSPDTQFHFPFSNCVTQFGCCPIF